jgi:type II secretory pathway pseudopilin PulG
MRRVSRVKEQSMILRHKGLTLVELLVGLIVASIILGAIASLIFAVGTTHSSSSDTAAKQAQVRFATVRISELIRYCKLVYATSANRITIWKADDDSDNNIDASELAYIETGTGKNYISLRYGVNPSVIYIVPECSNVQFLPDAAGPWTESVSVSFDIEEEGETHSYQINAVLRARAGHLLDAGGNIVGDDD